MVIGESGIKVVYAAVFFSGDEYFLVAGSIPYIMGAALLSGP